MAATTTFGQIEHRIRRDLLNDNDSYAYRWEVAAVMSRMNEIVVDIVERYNSWAGYNQESGVALRRAQYCNSRIKELCDSGNDELVNNNQSTINELRNIVMPLDDRYADAVANLTAAKLLETDDSDTMNQQKAAQFQQIGKDIAIR